jgi:hypothetical protein
MMSEAKKFKTGDVVVLSAEGRKELKRLRRRTGTVAGAGMTDRVYLIVWGTGIVMHNHEDNLTLKSGGGE